MIVTVLLWLAFWTLALCFAGCAAVRIVFGGDLLRLLFLRKHAVPSGMGFWYVLRGPFAQVPVFWLGSSLQEKQKEAVARAMAEGRLPLREYCNTVRDDDPEYDAYIRHVVLNDGAPVLGFWPDALSREVCGNPEDFAANTREKEPRAETP